MSLGLHNGGQSQAILAILVPQGDAPLGGVAGYVRVELSNT